MDYRNADGSVAEMCGNGLRLFSRYLLNDQLVQSGEFTVATRARLKYNIRHIPVNDCRTLSIVYRLVSIYDM